MTNNRPANQPARPFDGIARKIAIFIGGAIHAALRRVQVWRITAQLRRLDSWVLEDVGLCPWQIPGLAEALVDGATGAVPVSVRSAIFFVPGRFHFAANDYAAPIAA